MWRAAAASGRGFVWEETSPARTRQQTCWFYITFTGNRKLQQHKTLQSSPHNLGPEEVPPWSGRQTGPVLPADGNSVPRWPEGGGPGSALQHKTVRPLLTSSVSHRRPLRSATSSPR